VQIVSTSLQRQFLHIFDHLYKIWENEGVSLSEGCIEKSPFTGILIIQDYYCNVPNDTNDFSYNFFVWLGTNDKLLFFIFYSYLIFLKITFINIFYFL
jgi:hypothetical protein